MSIQKLAAGVAGVLLLSSFASAQSYRTTYQPDAEKRQRIRVLTLQEARERNAEQAETATTDSPDQTYSITQARNRNRTESLGSRTLTLQEARARLSSAIEARTLNEQRRSASAAQGRRVIARNETRSIQEARQRNAGDARAAATRGRTAVSKQTFTIAEARQRNARGAVNLDSSFEQSSKFHSQSMADRRRNNRR